jgi:hypothetical protein
MKLMKNITLLPIVIIILSAAAARAAECTRYSDSDFHYSICAPHDWKKNYREDGDRHHLVLKRAGATGAEISVTASRIEEDGKSEGNDWKKWHGRGTGSGFRKIIETKELAAGDNVSVKIVVFDYYSRGVRMLQRTMLSRYGEKFLVVECRAPLRSFSRYTELFNMVMSSVDYTGTLTGDELEDRDADKPAAPGKEKTVIRKKAVVNKKAEPKKRADIVKRKEPDRGSAISQPRGGKNDSPVVKPGEEKIEAALNNKGESLPEGVIRKGEDVDIDLETVEDPEAKKVIESELNTLQDMERRGLIEKIEQEK